MERWIDGYPISIPMLLWLLKRCLGSDFPSGLSQTFPLCDPLPNTAFSPFSSSHHPLSHVPLFSFNPDPSIFLSFLFSLIHPIPNINQSIPYLLLLVSP